MNANERHPEGKALVKDDRPGETMHASLAVLPFLDSRSFAFIRVP
jgi:hypothetical protein